MARQFGLFFYSPAQFQFGSSLSSHPFLPLSPTIFGSILWFILFEHGLSNTFSLLSLSPFLFLCLHFVFYILSIVVSIIIRSICRPSIHSIHSIYLVILSVHSLSIFVFNFCSTFSLSPFVFFVSSICLFFVFGICPHVSHAKSVS